MATHTKNRISAEVAIIGAGIIGISCTYYRRSKRPGIDITLVDSLAPMSLTSTASGKNYRSLWPREEIGSLTRRSIELMEDVVQSSRIWRTIGNATKPPVARWTLPWVCEFSDARWKDL